MPDDPDTYPTIFACFTMNHIFEVGKQLIEEKGYDGLSIYNMEDLDLFEEDLSNVMQLNFTKTKSVRPTIPITSETLDLLKEEIQRAHEESWETCTSTFNTPEMIIDEAFAWYAVFNQADFELNGFVIMSVFVQLHEDRVREIVNLEREKGNEEWADDFTQKYLD